MNESRLHLNDNDPDDRITKKDLKESEVTTYINIAHLRFQPLNHRNFKFKHILLNPIPLLGNLLKIFIKCT